MFMNPEDYARMKEKYPKFNEPWTADELEELEAMARDKVALDAMAESLQRTKNAIRMKLKGLGLWEERPRALPWTEEDDKLLIERYEAGDALDVLATGLDRSERAIVSRLVKLRLSLFKQ